MTRFFEGSLTKWVLLVGIYFACHLLVADAKCDPTPKKICAKNGVTYDSQCHLREAYYESLGDDWIDEWDHDGPCVKKPTGNICPALPKTLGIIWEWLKWPPWPTRTTRKPKPVVEPSDPPSPPPEPVVEPIRPPIEPDPPVKPNPPSPVTPPPGGDGDGDGSTGTGKNQDSYYPYSNSQSQGYPNGRASFYPESEDYY